jgi:molecular chaperone GrpE
VNAERHSNAGRSPAHPRDRDAIDDDGEHGDLDRQRPDPGRAAVAVAEIEQQLLRALADLDNFRKRHDREVARERASERMRVASQWLPIVDDLERALQHASRDPSAIVEGVRSVRNEAVATLERLGFPRFEDLGRQFDPARHDTMGVIEADASPGTIVEVVRPGYGTDDEVLRPAGVVVAKQRG